MDISQYNVRVIQEPRGMIRIITLIFAILAFSATSGFDTYTSFKLYCGPDDKVANVMKAPDIFTYKLTVEYPFEFDGIKVGPVKEGCNSSVEETHDLSKMDFTSSAQFYVATGVLSFLYSTAALVLYIFGTRHYESNPLVPVIDLGVTVVLTVFWLGGSCAWAAGVSDINYYTKPEYIWGLLKFCVGSNVASETGQGVCNNTFPGKFTALNISLIFGFANIFLWAASCWFVFKETQFHRKPIPEMGVPGQQSFDQFGGQMAGQPQIPGQTVFPQQRQFSEGY